MIKTTDGFDRWYKVYPRRQSKGDAFKAWNQVGGEEIADEIIKATKRYPFSDDTKYIKLPATWLRAWCWDDQFDEEGNNGGDW